MHKKLTEDDSDRWSPTISILFNPAGPTTSLQGGRKWQRFYCTSRHLPGCHAPNSARRRCKHAALEVLMIMVALGILSFIEMQRNSKKCVPHPVSRACSPEKNLNFHEFSQQLVKSKTVKTNEVLSFILRCMSGGLVLVFDPSGYFQ